ncbi:leucyl aminopeptidase [Hydrogenophaga sp. 5NK40-0174]|uniref:leucyl aminopeptidase n=1 Tax=Hydrogenophaga sp. 5NK40-0174 TaxID=3127649 RepID=UPI00310B6C7F
MNFEIKTLSPEQAVQAAVDALIVLIPDDFSLKRGQRNALTELVHDTTTRKEVEAGVGKSLMLYRAPGFKASRLVLVRCGDATPAQVRSAVSAAMGHVRHASTRKVAILLSLLPDSNAAIQAAMMAAADATYTYTETKPSAKASAIKTLQLGVPAVASAKAAFAKAQAAVVGVTTAREWANRPGNHATPTMLAKAAVALGKKPGIKTEVLGPKEVEKLGMGSFMAVAQGSAEPLRFIIMRYNGGKKSDAPVVLVGKGITFDTGGISLKPGAGMDEMKFDMGGAASVLGTFAALAELKPSVNVVGLIPTCENMPDGKAIKPGDVVTSMSGQTIEILNTDAEGRLILCDALTYAARFKPACIVDIATLTGACVIALGSIRTGMYATTDALAQSLSDAGERSLDLCWRMPLDEAYADGLKSNFADMANVADRKAGSVTAAKFLQKFVGEHEWAHLDIAGSAWNSGGAKGATGRPVPLLLEFLVSRNSV